MPMEGFPGSPGRFDEVGRLLGSSVRRFPLQLELLFRKAGDLARVWSLVGVTTQTVVALFGGCSAGTLCEVGFGLRHYQRFVLNPRTSGSRGLKKFVPRLLRIWYSNWSYQWLISYCFYD
jgi:hypothetical protein